MNVEASATPHLQPCANPKCLRPFHPRRPWHKFCRPSCRVVSWKLLHDAGESEGEQDRAPAPPPLRPCLHEHSIRFTCHQCQDGATEAEKVKGTQKPHLLCDECFHNNHAGCLGTALPNLKCECVCRTIKASA